MLGRLAGELIVLIVALDPIGSIPAFLETTAGLYDSDRQEVALAAALVALIVLLLALYGGEYVLAAIGVGVPGFRLAAGAMLFVLALRMVVSGQRHGTTEANRAPTVLAIVPVALPGIANPAALLAVVLLAANSGYAFAAETVTAGLTAAVTAGVLAALLSAAQIRRALGTAGIAVVSQVMGLILAVFAGQQVLDGAIEALGRPLPSPPL